MNDKKELVNHGIQTAYDWHDDIVFEDNHTAFGIYNDDQKFKEESVGVAKYVVRSLGYPHINVQLMPQHIFTSFQAATMKYSSIVNQSKISDNLLSVFGQKIGQVEDLSSAAIYSNLGPVIQISSMYGQQSIIKNSLNIPIHTTTINVIPNKQQYDLLQPLGIQIDQYANIQIIQVYHYPIYPNANFDLMTTPGMDTYNVASSFGGVMASNSRFTIMPIFESLQRMQHLELSQQIRRSHFGFEMRHNKILFFPPPRRQIKIDIDYILKSDKRKRTYKQDAVNNVSNFPINEYLKYQSINTPGRNWIQRFTLALCKQLLGIIRSKFLSLPYTEGQISMDGQSLRSQGVEQQDKLIEQLKLLLEESSMFRLIQKKAQMSEHLQTINSKIPTRIFMG